MSSLTKRAIVLAIAALSACSGPQRTPDRDASEVADSGEGCGIVPGACHRPLLEQYAIGFPVPDDHAHLDARDAVTLVQRRSEHCQPGLFRMMVRSVGRQEGRLYLDSEPSYRNNPLNLAVSISANAEKQLDAAFGKPIENVTWYREILVTGVARRIKILLSVPSCPGCFYYQTHVVVNDPAQIEVAGLTLQGAPKPVDGRSPR